jgi:hypothetical protein
VAEYFGIKRRDEENCIIVKHGTLMEYERNIL